MANHEVILEFSKMAAEHTASLWKIASGFIALEVLIISQVLVRPRVAVRRAVVLLSVVANIASLICGYISDAGLLYALKDYTVDNSVWRPSREAELFNLLQMSALTAGLLLFVVAFTRYSRVLAGNLIRASAHLPAGKADEHSKERH
jgi:hypothetical protein